MAAKSSHWIWCERDWAIPVEHLLKHAASQWVLALGGIAAAVAQEKGVAGPAGSFVIDDAATAVARSLMAVSAKRCCWATPPHTMPKLLSCWLWPMIGEHTGATVGYLTEAANTVGAVCGCPPRQGWFERGPDVVGWSRRSSC